MVTVIFLLAVVVFPQKTTIGITIELSFNVVEFDDVESYEVVLGFLSTSVLGFGLIEWNNFRFYFCVMTLNF